MRFFVSIVLICISSLAMSQHMKIASYNIRYANPKDSGNLWQDRKTFVVNLIRFHQFEIFGIQEGLRSQIDDLESMMPEFSWYGIGRDDGISKGEHSAIFYKTDLFQLEAKGDFWLSTTPEKPGPGWDANLNRICTWVKLKHKKTNQSFFIFNAHYDHQGVQARIESSKLILQKIQSLVGNSPAVFMGDLNGGRESDWYVRLAKSGLLLDSYELASSTYQPNGSFNGFRFDDVRKDVIDHIFVSKAFAVARWAVHTDTYNGKFPSDHFPVSAELKLK